MVFCGSTYLRKGLYGMVEQFSLLKWPVPLENLCRNALSTVRRYTFTSLIVESFFLFEPGKYQLENCYRVEILDSGLKSRILGPISRG